MAKKISPKPITKVATTATVSEPLVPIGPDFFEKMGKNAVWFCLALLGVIAFFIFKDYLTLKKIFLFKDIGSDTLNGTLPYHYYISHYIPKNGIPTWSFAEGMGQSVFAGLTRDPFITLSYLGEGKAIPQIFIFIEVTKILIGGIVFFYFLKLLKASNFSAILGSVLFSFSGFMIIGACWYLFTYEALNVAMLLLAFELFYQRGKWMLFVFTIFLVGIAMPFNVYVFGLFLAFYAAFRILQEPGKNYKDLLLIYGKLILLGVAGLLLGGPFLIETIVQLLESPRGSGGNSYFQQLAGQPMFHVVEREQFGAAIMRLFSSDMLGSGVNYSINGVLNNGQFVQKNWGNFLEAPMSYCGILCLILLPQIFSSVDKKVRKWYVFFLLFVVIPSIFPYFRYMIWLFTGDYYRAFSFFISLVFILFSVHALDLILKHRKLNFYLLIGTVVFWLILESYPYFSEYQKLTGNKPVIDEAVSLFAKVLIFAYAGLLFILSKSKNPVNIKYAIIGLVAFEAIYLSGLSVNRRDVVLTRELKEKVGYNDYSVDAVNYIKENEKSAFYRIDKNYFSSPAIHGSLNDHKIQGYYGTSSYNSWSQLNFINYMRSYELIKKDNEYSSRWVDGLINRPIQIPVMESLNNVKYILAKHNAQFNPYWQMSHDSINKFGDVLVLRNKYSLPFGYTYDTYMKQSNFDKLNVFQKVFVSLKSCILKDEDIVKSPGLKEFKLQDTLSLNAFSWESYKADLDKLKKDTLNMSLFSEKKIEGTVKANETEIMYFSFPYDKGWHLNVDGKDTEKVYVSNGMTGVYLTKGSHNIELFYKLRYGTKGSIMSLCGLLFCGGLFFLFRRKKTEE